MNQEIPKHQNDTVNLITEMLADALPDIFETTYKGITLHNPHNLTVDEIYKLAEEAKPGILDDIQLIIDSAKHPNQ